MNYTVNVGNIGNIQHTSKKEALKTFTEYVEQSKGNYGRASNEIVILYNDKTGDIIKEYFPPDTIFQDEFYRED